MSSKLLCEIESWRNRQGHYRCKICRRHYKNITQLPIIARCPVKFSKAGSPVARQMLFEENVLATLPVLPATEDLSGMVTTAEFKERTDICATCEHRRRSNCALCGCGLIHKAKSILFDCPDQPSRWPVIDPARLERVRVSQAGAAVPVPEARASFMNKLGGLAAASAKFIASGMVMAGKEEAARRLEICKGCGEFDNDWCSRCSCYMPLKTMLAAMKCPLPEPKWVEVNATTTEEKEG